jgi:hypothetical protein
MMGTSPTEPAPNEPSEQRGKQHHIAQNKGRDKAFCDDLVHQYLPVDHSSEVAYDFIEPHVPVLQ